jgi:hypothetical protein
MFGAVSLVDVNFDLLSGSVVIGIEHPINSDCNYGSGSEKEDSVGSAGPTVSVHATTTASLVPHGNVRPHKLTRLSHQ